MVPPHRPPRVVKCSLTLIQAFGSLLVAPTTHPKPPSVPNLTNWASTTDRSTHLRNAALAPSSQTTTDGMHDGLSWASGAESSQRAFCNHLGGPRSRIREYSRNFVRRCDVSGSETSERCQEAESKDAVSHFTSLVKPGIHLQGCHKPTSMLEVSQRRFVHYIMSCRSLQYFRVCKRLDLQNSSRRVCRPRYNL